MVVDSSLYAEPGVAWVTGILVFSCLPENVLQSASFLSCGTLLDLTHVCVVLDLSSSTY